MIKYHVSFTPGLRLWNTRLGYCRNTLRNLLCVSVDIIAVFGCSAQCLITYAFEFAPVGLW